MIGQQFLLQTKPKTCEFLGIFKVKTVVVTFLATFCKNWVNFIPTSGHTESILDFVLITVRKEVAQNLIRWLHPRVAQRSELVLIAFGNLCAREGFFQLKNVLIRSANRTELIGT